jgi:hypothetical protein
MPQKQKAGYQPTRQPLLAFSEDFRVFHVGYVFEACLNKRASLFKVMGNFNVIFVVCNLKYCLFNVYVKLGALKRLMLYRKTIIFK